MTQQNTRRNFLKYSAAITSAITVMPYAAYADGHRGDKFENITINPISHASFVMTSPNGTIYVDPVGDAADYASFAEPDLVLITHHHGDHFKQETLNAIVSENTQMIVNPEVYAKLPAPMQAKARQLANGESTKMADIAVDAIPAYNTTKGREKFHPKGRDNGYIVSLDGQRIYISGDTEDIPDMRALKNIDIAFVCMNLPFTMDVKAAASAVAEFKPAHVYPYHYRGRDNGTQDPQEFADLVGAASDVKLGKWYG
ncbi:MBL fold metallo-hydrolase [Lentilitoribacter sp. Alg239-R112]|uniref:MBL fold metallo-hydrolase n=1 Tax=Lentilitoribacter sp. Alg239-R112 TaxID=2305987 RepID=UPI0013A6C7BD|nr:MBL fold metallo-hydrolase [Lentilitoribacter sp. Alg239-R112]